MDVYDPAAVENEDEEDSFGREVQRLRCERLAASLLSLRLSWQSWLQGHEQLREFIIFLVDASPSMQQPAHGEIPEVTGATGRVRRPVATRSCVPCLKAFLSQEYHGKTWLQIALMTFESFLRARIISNANDQLALVFYGTVSFCLLIA